MTTPSQMSQEAAVVEVAHALNMLAELPSHIEDPGLPVVVRAACMESYFINLRLVFEFLSGKYHENEIRAYDFLPGWKPAKDEKFEIFRRKYGFASEQVAHLAKKRAFPEGSPITPHPIEFPIATLVIIEVIDHFADALSAAHSPYADVFRNAIAGARTRFKWPDEAHKPQA